MTEDALMTALGGAGGVSVVVYLARFLMKQVTSGIGEARSENAYGDVIQSLRSELERVSSRVENLEGRVTSLMNRLVDVRGHALEAFQIVTSTYPLTDEARAKIQKCLTSIIKDDL